MRKEGKSVNEKIDFKELVLNKVLPKGIDKKDLKVEVKVKKPHTAMVSILDKNNRVLFSGLSECSPEDKWDTFIGLTLAIARLKINVNSYIKRQKKKIKTWIPKLGDVYYIPYMDILTREVYATKIVWTDGDLDFIRLSLGNIYRTEREARKAIRKNILNGRHIVKEARKYA
jgi:hypothetical protein